MLVLVCYGKTNLGDHLCIPESIVSMSCGPVSCEASTHEIQTQLAAAWTFARHICQLHTGDTKIRSIDSSLGRCIHSSESFLSSFLCQEWHVCIFPTKFPSESTNVSQSNSHWQEQLAQREAQTKWTSYCDEFLLDQWFVVDSLLELSARWFSILNLS